MYVTALKRQYIFMQMLLSAYEVHALYDTIQSVYPPHGQLASIEILQELVRGHFIDLSVRFSVDSKRIGPTKK